MPGLIGVGEFVEETREDYNSPTTSTFVSRMPQCRQSVGQLEEVSKCQSGRGGSFWLRCIEALLGWVMCQIEIIQVKLIMKM